VVKKRKKQKNSRSARREAAAHPPESRAAEAITIMWSLCMLATTVALLIMWFGKWVGQAIPPADDLPHLIHVLPGLLLFTASVTGMLSMALTWPTYKLRRTRPPLAVSLYALGIGLTPWLLIVVSRW